jgi:hypothetical protein
MTSSSHDDHFLKPFQDAAKLMRGDAPATWQWEGDWDSQKMYGITEKRAKENAKNFGGVAKPMEQV